MNRKWLWARAVCVILICMLLSGCQLFCAIAAVASISNWNLFVTFVECSVADSSDPTEICPSSGIFYPDPSNLAVKKYCEPGDILPFEPSFATPVPEGPSSSSSSQAVVQAAHVTLPQAPRRSRHGFPKPAPEFVDCTDPANVGNQICTNSGRQNKGLPQQ